MTANDWIKQELGDDFKPSDAVARIIRDAFNDGTLVGREQAIESRNQQLYGMVKRLKGEVTRLNDRVRALKHENNKLRKELWQRKESK